MNPLCYCNIPSDKLVEAISIAYELSVPQGLGFLHARNGGLDEETVNEIIERDKNNNRIAASMDYVHGRSCKFTVFRYKDKSGLTQTSERLLIYPDWYDHDDFQLEELLTRLGVSNPAQEIADAREAQRIENEEWKRNNP